MIRLRNIERCYPLAKGRFFYVLRDINLDIAEGEFVSIMGPSGAGKASCEGPDPHRRIGTKFGVAGWSGASLPKMAG